VAKSSMKMDGMQMLAWVLLVVGGLNWGLIGLLNVNLVDAIFGSSPALVQIVYIIVGLAGLYALWGMFMMKK
jgi:uncharacterized protein